MAAASGDCPSLYSFGCVRTAPEHRSTSSDVELVPSMQILVMRLRRSAGMAASKPKRALQGHQGHCYVSFQALGCGMPAFSLWGATCCCTSCHAFEWQCIEALDGRSFWPLTAAMPLRKLLSPGKIVWHQQGCCCLKAGSGLPCTGHSNIADKIHAHSAFRMLHSPCTTCPKVQSQCEASILSSAGDKFPLPC